MNDSAHALRVRTFRIANGTHLLSFTDEQSSCPTLLDALEMVPLDVDVVVNLDGLDEGAIHEALASLRLSPRARTAPRKVVVVCGEESGRRLLAHSGLDDFVRVEPSLDDALGYALGLTWLSSLAS